MGHNVGKGQEISTVKREQHKTWSQAFSPQVLSHLHKQFSVHTNRSRISQCVTWKGEECPSVCYLAWKPHSLVAYLILQPHVLIRTWFWRPMALASLSQSFILRLTRRYLGTHRLLNQTFEPPGSFNFFVEIFHFIICCKRILSYLLKDFTGDCFRILVTCLKHWIHSDVGIRWVSFLILVGLFLVLGLRFPFQLCSGYCRCDTRRLSTINSLF